MKNLKLIQKLEKLTNSMSVSGYEWELGIVDVIQKLIGKEGRRVGNCLTYKFGEGKRKIMISAHMDEVGFMVTKPIGKKSKIVPIGDVSADTLVGKRLVFSANGKLELSSQITNAKSFSDLWVSFKNPVSPGVVGTYEKIFENNDDFVFAPSLDNKVGCLALIELIRKIEAQKLGVQIIICFVDREEILFTGISSVLREYNPDLVIDIDSAYALPLSLKNRSNWCIPEIGKGPAVQLMGTDFIVSSQERRLIEKVATENKIKFRYEIPDGSNGGTNSSRTANMGYKVMQINIPVANQHTAKSKVSMTDIQNTIILLEKLVFQLDEER